MIFHFSKAATSLRARLVLIPAVFLMLGIVIAIVVKLSDARERIAAETASGLTIGGHLIEYALEDIRFSADPEIALNRLKIELSHVRHIRLGYRPSPNAPIAVEQVPSRAQDTPPWLINLFAPHRDVKIFPVDFHGEHRGDLALITEPADEGSEVWGELVFLISLLSAVSGGIILLTWLAVNYTLRPLNELVDGLARLGRGQFNGVSTIRVAELASVGEQFNKLAKSLGRTEADNRLLIERLMSIQESERKELARELHDEFGASLFGIRASASYVQKVARSDGPPEPRFTKIAERADAISSLADTIQRHNYQILERIRPIALTEMKLFDALTNLAEEWSGGHGDIACEIKTSGYEPDLSDDMSLIVYRIVQECLTNIARHSAASRAQITVDVSADDVMTIRVTDNGRGLPANFRFGFGFLGMSERARKLGGSLKVANDPSGGTLVEVEIPFLCHAAAV